MQTSFSYDRTPRYVQSCALDASRSTNHERDNESGSDFRKPGKPGTDGTFSDSLSMMARLSRIVVVNLPHHVTQRGNARQFILACDSERSVYLELLRKYVQLLELSLIGYCLMSNHVHLVAIPRKPDALARALKQTHGRYASYWNAAHRSTGHVWQGRFYSCPLDSNHLWVALRYAELNPVRAGLVAKANSWPWSSAAAHCGSGDPNPSLEMALWDQRWSAETWREYLAAGETESEIAAIRQCTHSGRPLGGSEFIHDLEQTTLRRLLPQKGGRPRDASNLQAQAVLSFEK
jgi:putative transposase